MKQQYGTGLTKAERIARNTPQSRGRPMKYAPIPSDAQYAVITRMKQGEELRYLWHEYVWLGSRRDRIDRRTFDAMLRAGWIERDTSPGGSSRDCNGDRYILTPSGQGA